MDPELVDFGTTDKFTLAVQDLFLKPITDVLKELK